MTTTTGHRYLVTWRYRNDATKAITRINRIITQSSLKEAIVYGQAEQQKLAGCTLVGLNVREH